MADRRCKVVCVGTTRAGKSSLVQAFLYGYMSREYAGTVGVEFHSKTVFLPDGPVRLQLWDTAGHERFSALVPTYLKSAEAVLLTFDLTDRASFDEVTQYAELIAKHAVGLAPTRVLVLGNKSDLDDQRQVSHQEAAAKSIELGYDYMEVSATQPTNVVRCFRHLVAQVVAPDGRLEPTCMSRLRSPCSPSLISGPKRRS
ncbi:uncharacterized protein MONBRDRAFT_15030 [Monosiga brevicollis MX1]|uniref:Uncharacterized protein n=1 Tax=Monosiga brevicollis TaxID=81824 RepID=A9UTW3_MONBE|nr:uncharacterized protein MONBRDRAFT_15030 [Monosiga brevicollis MX1]EDQ91316.1 predicted protein [Monosiga brevicollis MX1]|eukprot:XP_001743738.1 hypothetical protein [Monosiga brevicollis MX1]